MSYIKFGWPPKFGVVFEATPEGIAKLLNSESDAKAFARAIQHLVKLNGVADRQIQDPLMIHSQLVEKLGMDASLSKEERVWLRGYLTGEIVVAKAKKIGRPAARSQLLVFIFVELLRKANFNPMRNEVSPEISGCDVMAAAFKLMEQKPTSYSGVKSAYLAGRKEWNSRRSVD